MSLVPRYEMDGSFESFMRLMRDAAAGVPAACDIIEGYRQYQELSREVLLKRLPPRAFYEPYGGTVATYPSVEITWTVIGPHGEPSTAELDNLRRELEKRLPAKPREVTGVPRPSPGLAEKQPYAPPGVHLTSHTRIGDEVRNTYLDHLGARFSDGSIDQAEFNARSDAAVKARTKEELEMLITDLPAIAEKKEPEKKTSSFSSFPPVFSLLMFMTCFSVIFTPGIGAGVFIFIFLSVFWGTIFLGRWLGETPLARISRKR